MPLNPKRVNMSVFFLIFKKQIPVDVLPNRKKEYLLNYFQKIPLEERKKGKIRLFRHV